MGFTVSLAGMLDIQGTNALFVLYLSVLKLEFLYVDSVQFGYVNYVCLQQTIIHNNNYDTSNVFATIVEVSHLKLSIHLTHYNK